MKKYSKLLILVLFLVLPLNKVYAICSTEEIEHFKEIEDKYTYTYELDKETKKYSITLHNPDTEHFGYFIEKTVDGGSVLSDFTEENQEDLTIYELEPGKYGILVYGKTETCDSRLKSDRITLPRYNEFYGDPLCEGIEEFVLCQETYDKEIDYETFVSRVNNYKANMQPKEEQKEEKKNPIIEKLNNIWEFIVEHIIIIIGGIVILVLLVFGIIRLAKSIRKSRRLE